MSTDHRADPVRAVAEAIWTLHDGAYLADQAGADEALELARVAVEAARPAIERETKAAAWDEGFTRGFYDALAGGDRDASESAAENPYRIEREGRA